MKTININGEKYHFCEANNIPAGYTVADVVAFNERDDISSKNPHIYAKNSIKLSAKDVCRSVKPNNAWDTKTSTHQMIGDIISDVNIPDGKNINMKYTNKQLLDNFEKWCCNKDGRTANTASTYKANLWRLQENKAKTNNYYFDEITNHEIVSLVKEMRENKTSLNWVNTEGNALNEAYYNDTSGNLELFKKFRNNTKVKTMSLITDKIEKVFKNSKQLVLTGAPGTGKTFAVREYVKQKTNNNENHYKFVQFHSSYDYTDFVEGIRPVPGSNDQNSFVKLDGVFKEFCRRIVNEELKKFDENIVIDEEFTKNKSEENESYAILDNYYCDQKSKCEDESDIEIADDSDNNSNNYYFVIDEINRADLSKVFGELMFGLEETYRGIENRFDTQYKNLDTFVKKQNGKYEKLNFDCFRDGFFIPKNLYIIGTMNDIDRSVESFDFALRRRFKWIEISAQDSINDKLGEMIAKKYSLDPDVVSKWIDKANKVNNEIKDAKNLGLNESYELGPSYFKDYDGTEGKIKEIIDEQIIPIIMEYTRGRPFGEVQTLIEKIKGILLS